MAAPPHPSAPLAAASPSPVQPPDEQELLRFGPMGLGISFARPALFVKVQQNCTEIVVTNRRLYGVRRMPRFAFARHGREAGRTIFDISHDDIVRIERADYLLNRALWIQHRSGEGTKGVGIEAGLFWYHHIARLEEALRELEVPCG